MIRHKLLPILCLLTVLILAGCGHNTQSAQVAATTLPVYEFTARLCENTDIAVTQLITESVSCLHDYTLKVEQMQVLEGASTVVISGAGLEDFLDDALAHADTVIDSAQGISPIHCDDEHHHDHAHEHTHDPHIWLSPANAKIMAANICSGLCTAFPHHSQTLQANLEALTRELDTLQSYGEQALSQLSCRELVTFHDGFAYFAQAFDLTILRAIEEESGSEASAAELKELICLVREHHLPAIFTERSGSASAAGVICAETGVQEFALDMAMSGSSYFDAMYHNINTIKEALG